MTNRGAITAAGGLAALLGLLLPWSRWWGRPDPVDPWQAVPLWLVAIGGLVLLGLWLMAVDCYLGAFVAYTAVAVLWAPPEATGLLTAFHVAIGAGVIVSIRMLPSSWRQRAPLVITAAVVMQTAWALGQALGWIRWWPGGPYQGGLHTGGTLGNPDWLGAYVAMLAPVTPWAVAPALVGLELAHARGAALAALAGLLARTRQATLVALLPLAAMGLVVYGAFAGRALSEGLGERLVMWRQGLALTALNPSFGYGPGSWAVILPSHQPPGPAWYPAHNEILGLFFEGGIVALALLVWWLWDHRAVFIGPYGGALVALLVACQSTSVFHHPQLAGPALVLLGLATAEEGCR